MSGTGRPAGCGAVLCRSSQRPEAEEGHQRSGNHPGAVALRRGRDGWRGGSRLERPIGAYRRDESITFPGKGLDKAGIVGRIAQSITQLLDGSVDAVFEVDEAPIRPEGGTQLFTGDDRARVFEKQREKAEGLALKLDERAFPPEFTPVKVGFEDAEADRTGPVTLFISAHIPLIPLGLIVHPRVH